MRTRVNRIHPALKHGAYSATAVLPGESQAEFEKLHRDTIAELAPSGVVENDIIMTLARLLWRKQNLMTFRIAEHAQNRRSEIINEKVDRSLDSTEYFPLLSFERPPRPPPDPVKRAAQMRAAEEQTQKELGDAYELTTIGEAATLDGLTKELEVKERLHAAIAGYLKLLLLVRGVKSVSAAPPSASSKRIKGHRKLHDDGHGA
jgi:hypothetical protein